LLKWSVVCRLAAALGWVIGLTALPGHAHLGTPWLPAGDALLHGERVLLVRVEGPGHHIGEGTETAVVVLDELSESASPVAPGPIRLWQEGPHRHALEPGALVVVVVNPTPAGGWRSLAETRTPLRMKPGGERAAKAFVRQWRTPTGPPLDPIEEGLGLLGHASELARRVGFERLTTEATLRPRPLSLEQLERLFAGILLPDTEEADRLARLRLVEVLGGTSGVEMVMRRFHLLPGERLQGAAAGLLARHPQSGTRSVLETCAAGSGGLAARCARLLGAPSPPPADAP